MRFGCSINTNVDGDERVMCKDKKSSRATRRGSLPMGILYLFFYTLCNARIDFASSFHFRDDQ